MSKRANPLGVSMAMQGNYYSPELSTDFLELPQSVDEQWNYYRHFYKHDPLVHAAINFHSDIPLSKVRIGRPDCKNHELGEKATKFVEKWSRDIDLLARLMEIVHEYNLLGVAHIFVEDTNPDMPHDIRNRIIRDVDGDGKVTERFELHPDADERALAWMYKNYKGWTNVTCLPPEQVNSETFPFTSKQLVELIPDSRTKDLVHRFDSGDERAATIVETLPDIVVDAVRNGFNIPLNTDPYLGSFVKVMARRRSPYQDGGVSMLGSCIHTLVFRDKVRQSLTSIASRHMTPMRVVTAPEASIDQLEELREGVDMALSDPDYSLVTNYEVTWNEFGADQRLPDWSWVFELTDRQLYAGLSLTEALLSGESSYSGDRIQLEVINTRFLLLRETLQNMVEDYLFKPMCAKMGFIEEDDFGNEVVIVPKLSFTRLSLRDSQDTYEQYFSLYQKGSLPIEPILDMLNVDSVSAFNGLKNNLWTLNDVVMNEAIRGVLTGVSQNLIDETNVLDKIIKGLGLTRKEVAPEEDGSGGDERWGM